MMAGVQGEEGRWKEYRGIGEDDQSNFGMNRRGNAGGFGGCRGKDGGSFKVNGRLGGGGFGHCFTTRGVGRQGVTENNSAKEQKSFKLSLGWTRASMGQ